MSPVLKDHPVFPMYKTQNYLEDSSWFSICTHLCKYNHTWKCHLGQAKEPFQCQQTPVKNYYYKTKALIRQLGTVTWVLHISLRAQHSKILTI